MSFGPVQTSQSAVISPREDRSISVDKPEIYQILQINKGSFELFGLFKRSEYGNIRVMGHSVNVLSVTRNGKILFTGKMAKNYNKSHLEGKIFEVSISTKSGNPYFAYYVCENYYLAVAMPGNSNSFGGPNKTEEFRSNVSQQIAIFIVKFLKENHRIDASRDIVSFSHNRAHTNVLTYVSSLGDWYPIQHSELESDDASELKAESVNRGNADITDVIAVYEPSPSQ